MTSISHLQVASLKSQFIVAVKEIRIIGKGNPVLNLNGLIREFSEWIEAKAQREVFIAELFQDFNRKYNLADIVIVENDGAQTSLDTKNKFIGTELYKKLFVSDMSGFKSALRFKKKFFKKNIKLLQKNMDEHDLKVMVDAYNVKRTLDRPSNLKQYKLKLSDGTVTDLEALNLSDLRLIVKLEYPGLDIIGIWSDTLGSWKKMSGSRSTSPYVVKLRNRVTDETLKLKLKVPDNLGTRKKTQEFIKEYIMENVSPDMDIVKIERYTSSEGLYSVGIRQCNSPRFSSANSGYTKFGTVSYKVGF